MGCSFGVEKMRIWIFQSQNTCEHGILNGTVDGSEIGRSPVEVLVVYPIVYDGF